LQNGLLGKKCEASNPSEEGSEAVTLSGTNLKVQIWITDNQVVMESKVFDSGLLDVCLLDLIRKPSWSIGWLWNHANAARENVDTLGATLS
jgi:hypothetical protein